MANGRWHMAKRFRAESGTRWNASLPGKGVAWLVPRALVHAGEAGFKGIDAGDLPLQSGEQLPVVGVELLQERKVVGMHALTAGQHFGAELGAADQLRLGGFAAKEVLPEEEGRTGRPGNGRPALAGKAASGWDLGLEIRVHDAWGLMRET